MTSREGLGVGVQSQTQLPWTTAWHISIKGIRIRLARSAITAAGIFLGIAFYAAVRTSGLFPASGTSAEALAATHRQEWLAVMALLVSFVGIMNAMLMSVTERFKEIGTMKCLGALDSFVVRLFLIEALLMGLLASMAGWLVGWFLISVVHFIGDGPGAFGPAFWNQTGAEALECIGLGVAITLVAAIPPAARAAQMPPVAALRSEV